MINIININNIKLDKLQETLNKWHSDNRYGKLVLESKNGNVESIKLYIVDGKDIVCSLDIKEEESYE